jgi:hypothetical protein
MKIEKIKGMEIEVPNTSAFAIETADGLPRMHFLMLSISKRGGGKTVSITNLVSKLQKTGACDRVFIISPTIKSNKKILDMIKVDEEDVYDEPTRASLDSVIEKIEQEALDYEEYIEKMQVYKKYIQFMKTGRGNFDDLELFGLWDSESQLIQKPVHKWDGKKPVMICFFDDCQSTEVFSVKSRLNNLVIKHRHVGSFKNGGALGVSLIFAVQNYKTNATGIGRQIRNNVTHLMIFRSKDEAELEQIASEVSGEVSKETFMKAYEYATAEPHGFLYIDMHKKDNDPSMFRKCFNESIIINEAKDEEAAKEKSK